MRHLTGFLFGLVLAPVIWFLAALGHFRLAQALPVDGAPRGSLLELSLGALLLAAGGVWLGLLLGSRISPLGPAVAGILWLGLGAAFVLGVDAILNLVPAGPAGQRTLYELPLRTGYAFLIGTALMVPVFTPSRWRAAKAVDEDSDDEPKYVPFGPIDEPTGGHDATALRQRQAGENVWTGRVASPTGAVPRVEGTGQHPRVRAANGQMPHPEPPRPPRQWGQTPEQGSRTPWES